MSSKGLKIMSVTTRGKKVKDFQQCQWDDSFGKHGTQVVSNNIGLCEGFELFESKNPSPGNIIPSFTKQSHIF